LKISPEVEKVQVRKLQQLKKERNNKRVMERLSALRKAARDDENLMPRILACVREYATLGEMCNTLKEEYGVYHEPIIF
jgi:methylmalonyl-CoA mutase N-terminal domain/subunit